METTTGRRLGPKQTQRVKASATSIALYSTDLLAAIEAGDVDTIGRLAAVIADHADAIARTTVRAGRI